MGSGGVAIAALPTVICLKVPFSDGLGGVFDNIVEFDVTGIDETATTGEVKETSRYSVNGQLLCMPIKGLNLVKYSEGVVKKVVVR